MKLNSYSFGSFLSVLFLLLGVLFGALEAKMSKEELIEQLKKLNVTWKVGINKEMPANYTPADRQKKQVCRGCRTILPRTDQKPPPRFFDARNKWRGICASVLNRIRHQGQCDSSWAVATAGMLSDRQCILGKGKTKVHLSAEMLLNCCEKCRLGGFPGCGGGAPDEAIKFWINTGLVTGGEVKTGEGCIPYSSDSFGGLNQDCPKECTNKHYLKTIRDDCFTGGTLYNVPPEESGIRQELFNNGPVLAKMTVYEDLDLYKGGVFVHILGDPQGLHFVKIIGYGVEGGKKYWLIANSHGQDFGDKGLLKLLRGTNHCGIEENVIAANVESDTDPPEEPDTDDTDYNYEESEEPEETDDPEEEVEYRSALIGEGEILEPSSLGKCVLIEIIFLHLYLNLYV